MVPIEVQGVTLSKGLINRAGNTLRAYMESDEDVSEERLEAALIAAFEFRRLHARPLQRATANLRYYVDKHTTARPITVGQRLKRLRTLADKLVRHPDMKLVRMHDIAGCRAVVETKTRPA